MEFDLDQEVITTNVYRAALKSNMRKAASDTKGNMALGSDVVLEVVLEAAEEDSGGTSTMQAQLRESTFTQRDWPLQSPLAPASKSLPLHVLQRSQSKLIRKEVRTLRSQIPKLFKNPNNLDVPEPPSYF